MASSPYFSAPAVGAAPLPTAQERADRIQAETRAAQRRPLFKPPPPRPQPLTETADVALRRVAEELHYMQRILDAVGSTLAEDTILAMRHALMLQQFDVVSQVLGHLASVIGTDDRVEAMERIGMESLRGRLLRGM